MKKIFISGMSMLPQDSIKRIKYNAVNNNNLKYEDMTSFPIIPLLNSYAKKDDEISIYIIMTADKNNNCQHNLQLLKQELKELNVKNDIDLNITGIIETPHEETKNSNINLFKKIIKIFDGSQVYADLTYATKITPIIMFMALNYAEKSKKGAIKTMVYGKYTHDGGNTGELFDVTSLYYLNGVIDIASQNNADIDSILKNLLD